VDSGRPRPKDSPSGESIFVTWSPKIYHEALADAPKNSAKKVESQNTEGIALE